MEQDRKNTPMKWSVWLPLLFAIILVVGIVIGMRLQSETPTVVELEEGKALNGQNHGKIEELLRYIEAKYVDEVDREELIDKAIQSILKQLDPHSVYYSEDQVKAVSEQLEGNFDGIGVEFIILDDTVVVITPIEGGPAARAGILAGDKIVEVEDSTVAGIGITNIGITSLLKGEKGTEVTVGIIRGKDRKVRRFTLKRDEIPNESMDVSYMLDNKTGYIKLNRFSATTYEEFMKGVEDLVEKHGMEDLVIDLRQNPGGYLQQATNILSQLFKEQDKLLVYTEGRTVYRSEYETTGRPFFKIDDIAVLIDEGSASASEILAGALQDQDRAYIIGRRSFGKGLVQEHYALRDGSALRLTVARYYTPSGRSIQKSYDDRENYRKDLQARYESGELSEENQIAILDTTKFYTSEGRVVYGGGGIIPDIFVPIDTTLLSEYYLRAQQHLRPFVYKYLTDHKKQFEYTSLKNFKRRFLVNDAILNEFTNYAAEQGLEKDTVAINTVKSTLAVALKAVFASNLFRDEGYFSVWNEVDPVVKRALQELNKSNPLSEYQHIR